MITLTSLFDTFFFVTLAIISGFLIDLVIPSPDVDETFMKSLVLLYLQIFIGVLILYAIDQIYLRITGRSSKTYFGINVYSVLFFLVQRQIVQRLTIVFDAINTIIPGQEVFY